MAALSSHMTEPTTAVVFIGNVGAGKSTLLSQLGANFDSGVSFMEGLTKEVSEQVVTLNGRQVILMDVPGLYEFDDETTMSNALKLTEALRKHYRYKLFFVLKADSRGLTSKDVALMSTVNKYVRQANGDKVEFRVIINQVYDDKVYHMFDENVVKDNFRQVFENARLNQYDLDIEISSVMLIRFDEAAVHFKRLKEDLSREIEAQPGILVKLEHDIKAENGDLARFSTIAVGDTADPIKKVVVNGAKIATRFLGAAVLVYVCYVVFVVD
ncbi:hypothetical protein B0O80DRAFT_438630 [Mortierella sp. GBAus27b]|nr:hypothetical protein BGX31_008159 [Mortierella sp. GBA43]KAI8360183.1 hypothetical protein B0O80DRAFT_438630 [Mortierella sp. GBAus27b]